MSDIVMKLFGFSYLGVIIFWIILTACDEDNYNARLIFYICLLIWSAISSIWLIIDIINNFNIIMIIYILFSIPCVFVSIYFIVDIIKKKINSSNNKK